MMTGSSVYDAGACPAREVLPKAPTAGEYAKRGTALHEYARLLSMYPERREELLLEVPEEWRCTAEGMDVSAFLSDLTTVIGRESAFVLNAKTRTTRYLGDNINRQYGKVDKYEIPFTVDIYGDVLGTRIEIDYKSGRHIGPVEEHGQRRVCATGIMLYAESTEVISRVGYIHETGEIVPDEYTFDYLDAIETCDFIVKTWDTVERVRAEYERGILPTVYPDRDNQCKYCDSFTSCPYWNNLAKSSLGLTAPTLDALPPEQLGQLMDTWKDVEKLAETMLDQLREHAIRKPLPTGEGKVFVVSERPGRRKFDQASARGMIVTLMGRLGASESEISEKIASLNKTGKPYIEVRKVNAT